MIEALRGIDWAVWGGALLVGFPLFVILLGELIFRVGESSEASPYMMPLAILKNGVLPLAFIALLLRKVAGFDASHLAVRIADTAFWIVALNAAVATFNVLFFRDGAPMAGRYHIPKLLLDLLRFMLVLVGAAIIVSVIWGVDLSSLITALGVGSVVIGLALQDTLGSLFAGIALVSSRQFRVGDYIRFGNEEGLVLAMNWRSVKIRTRAGDALFMPNGIIARQPVTVVAGVNGTSSMSVDLRFPYEVPPDEVIALLNEAYRVTPETHPSEPPKPRVKSFDDNGIRYGVAITPAKPWRVMAVRSEFLANVWSLAERRSIRPAGALNVDFHPVVPTVPDAAVDAVDLVTAVATAGTFPLDRPALERLLGRARRERYRAGERVVEQGTVADNVYVLLHGRVLAVYEKASGPAIPLHEFEPGQLMMTKSQLAGGTVPYSFRAATMINVVAIPVDDFKLALVADRALAHEIERILSARDDAARRTLVKAAPADRDSLGTNDRVELLREMFRS